MHTKPDLRVSLKWMIARSGSVITDVITLRFPNDKEHSELESRQAVSTALLSVSDTWPICRFAISDPTSCDDDVAIRLGQRPFCVVAIWRGRVCHCRHYDDSTFVTDISRPRRTNTAYRFTCQSAPMAV